MNILYCTSEAVPFIKTGGLADVAGSLPLEMKRQGHDIRVVLPLYGKIPLEYKSEMNYIGYFYVDLGNAHEYAGVMELEHEGVKFYFIDNERYFNRSKIYGEGDDGERFLFFSKACVQLPKVIGFKPNIIHSNDWHTAMVNVYIKDFARGDSYYWDIKAVYTIHNLKYQGVFPADILRVAGLSPEYFNDEALKFYDAVNFMKGGIVFSDYFTTVSKNYANEIKYDYFGEGLDGVIRKHEYKLKGIVNGIDYDEWNPKKDKYLSKNYDLKTIDKKIENKREIQRIFGLEIRDDVPMFAMVSRLVEMKGLELVCYIMDELLYSEDIQVVILGTGDEKYENAFRYFEYRYPDKLRARIYYNNEEAHLIYSGADFLLMPSLAEPCGISQLIAMRYGTIPIVRETGGLKDTVKPYNEFTGEGTGFSFSNINAHDLLYTIRQAIRFYYDEKSMKNIVTSAMNEENNWEKSAKEYIELYEELVK
ncbi:glycogen synthase GlgA [Miniphocaeibacter halophilus]|uniref:Glycogen synthase GlgA n=1 Tax=Miniphocaeibacter halophilus TaxID=2931922 RepID=A0AC61MV97_9FIRM|nr:glycogen synthase GlgA [Miniphocaeibacter halophilus]QQK07103.1 glycogen synthase GlgA [Miniphocaeibacter halophilus]